MVKVIFFGFLLLTSVSFAKDVAAKEESHEAKSEDSDSAHGNIPKEVISEMARDIKVPLKMWEFLEDKKSVDTNEVYVFSAVKVLLKEKNEGIVKQSIIEISYPRGGGELDLSNYLSGKQGTFFVNFDFPEFEDATYKKVLFISNSRKRKIDDQVFGSGCREFFDISDRFFKESKTGGIKVNTTRHRHISVLGGSFILIAKKNKQNYLTQVTFTDKEHKNLLCQEN